MKTLKNFQGKNEFHAYLRKNEKELLAFKKEQFKKADGISLPVKQSANKSSSSTSGDTITKTIIGNTYLYMDSHMDVHAKGVFSKSIKERGSRIWHLHDHEHKITAKVGSPQEIYEQEIDWKTLGIDKAGTTQALFMTSDIKKTLNPISHEGYKTGEIDQHSVGMRYVRIKVAYQGEEEEDKHAKALWDEYYPQLGNPEEADKEGVFWVVKEAKLIEISCVLEGSNPLTPTLEDKTTPLTYSTSKTEPSSDDTQLAEVYFKTLSE